MTIQCVKYSDTIGFTEDKPEGLYKLMVEGFDQPLVFEFEKAPNMHPWKTWREMVP